MITEVDMIERQADALLIAAKSAHDPDYPAHADEERYLRRRESPCGDDIRMLDFVADYHKADLLLLIESSSITDRQREILEYRHMGYQWREIAGVLSVSRQTVWRDIAAMIPAVRENRCDGLIRLLIDVFGWRAVSLAGYL